MVLLKCDERWYVLGWLANLGNHFSFQASLNTFAELGASAANCKMHRKTSAAGTSSSLDVAASVDPSEPGASQVAPAHPLVGW